MTAIERRAGWTVGRWKCCLKAIVDATSQRVTITLEVPRDFIRQADQAERVIYAAAREAAITALADELACLLGPAEPDTTIH